MIVYRARDRREATRLSRWLRGFGVVTAHVVDVDTTEPPPGIGQDGTLALDFAPAPPLSKVYTTRRDAAAARCLIAYHTLPGREPPW